MWFNRELFQRLERLKARHIEQSEFVAKELNSVRKRITTLEKQVNDLMNENVDLRSHLRKLEAKDKALVRVRDEERGGTVLKEKEFEPRIGDLVARRQDLKDIRKVDVWGFGLKMVGKYAITSYTREAIVEGYLAEWKVIARREDLK